MTLQEDDLYIVIGSTGTAIALDHNGSPYIMPVLSNGTPDWDNDSDIEWDELTPTVYKLYKTSWDALIAIRDLCPSAVFVK